MLPRYRFVFGLVGVCLLAVLAYPLPAWLAGQPITLLDEPNAQITITQDRVLTPLECVDLDWSTDVKPRLNGNPPQVQPAPLCYTENRLTHQIEFTRADGTTETVTITIRVMLFEHGWRFILIGLLGLAILVMIVPPKPQTSTTQPSLFSRFTLDQIMLGSWFILHSLLILTMLSFVASAGLLAGLWVLIGILALGVGFVLRAKIAQWMQYRAMIGVVVIGFILSVIVVEGGLDVFGQRDIWSGVQTWFASILVWMMAYWLLNYLRLRFPQDDVRRPYWQKIILLTLVMSILSIVWLFVRDTDYSYLPWAFGQPNPNSVIMYRASDQNIDALYGYVPTSQFFPLLWKLDIENPPIQRPTSHIAASQLCLTLDIVLLRYADGKLGCSSPTVSSMAHLLINWVLMAICGLVTFELTRLYLQSDSSAFYATMLLLLSAFNLWFVSIPSTDYGDLFIVIMGMWLLHRLFTLPHDNGRMFWIGMTFGLFLLYKFDVIHILFGLLILVYRRQWRVLLPLVVLPLIPWLFYRWIIPIYGVPYTVVEVTGWRTVNWLYQELLWYGDAYLIVNTLVTWVGYAANRITLAGGALTFFALAVAIVEERFPRIVAALGLGMFLCIAIFLWIFQFPYVNLVVGMLPFLYGAVAIGIAAVQERLRERPPSWQRQVLLVLVWALPLVHQILQWWAWTLRHYINYDYFGVYNYFTGG